MYKTSGASPEGRSLRKLGAARDPSWRPAVPGGPGRALARPTQLRDRPTWVRSLLIALSRLTLLNYIYCVTSTTFIASVAEVTMSPV